MGVLMPYIERDTDARLSYFVQGLAQFGWIGGRMEASSAESKPGPKHQGQSSDLWRQDKWRGREESARED